MVTHDLMMIVGTAILVVNVRYDYRCARALHADLLAKFIASMGVAAWILLAWSVTYGGGAAQAPDEGVVPVALAVTAVIVGSLIVAMMYVRTGASKRGIKLGWWR